MLENLMVGFSLMLNIEVLVIMVVGLILGLVLGAIPGLGSVLGIGVLLPLTYAMSPLPALVLLVTIFKGAMLGGSFSSILINTPGTPCAAATALDGYPLCVKGQSRKALQAAIFSSCFGDLCSDIVLIVGSITLARVVLKFGPSELFWIIILSLVLTAGLAGKSLWRGLMSMSIGLLLGAVGLDPLVNVPRLGVISMLGKLEGLDMVSVLLGAFALSEIFVNVVSLREEKNIKTEKVKDFYGPPLSLLEIKDSIKAFIIGTITGTIVGIIPGMGATAASFFAYSTAKQTYGGKSKTGKFGEGALPGVVSAESANSAVSGANLLPLLTLGIPGSATAAMILGAFMLQGITPGPGIFDNQGPLIYALFVTFIFANLFNLGLAYLFVKPISKLLRLNLKVTFPVVMIICLASVYSINKRLIDLGVMVAIGLLAYFMRKIKMPIAPLVISFILSKMAERYFRQSLAIAGDYSIFIGSTINKVVIFLILIIIIKIANQRIEEKKGRVEQLK